jgi:tetratricopeptide (TPR) repeat protein
MTTQTAYQQLDDDTQRLYRLIGAAHPGTGITVPAAAALAGRHVDDAERSLATLSAGRLATVRGPIAGMSRYTLTEQAREHAQALGIDDREQLDAALRQLVEYYRLACVSVALRLNPSRWYVGDGYDQDPTVVFGSERAALGWADAERDNLQAVQQAAFDAGMYAPTWQIIEGLWPWYTRGRMADDCIAGHTLGLQAATEEGNQRARARMLEGRAWGYVEKGHLHDAVRDAQDAQELEETEDHPVGAASAMELIGLAHLKWDKPEAAAVYLVRAREIFLAEDLPRGAAWMTRHLAKASYAAGRYLEAIGHYQQALSYFIRFPHERYHEARILLHLGRALVRVDSADEAVDAAERALVIAEEIGSPLEQALAHVQLADIAANSGDNDTEQRHLDAARPLVEGLQGTEAEQIRQRLAH